MIAKPDIKIFKLLMEKIQPSESVYIDDKEKHLIPAMELGMKIILFDNYFQLKNELAALLSNGQ